MHASSPSKPEELKNTKQTVAFTSKIKIIIQELLYIVV